MKIITVNVQANAFANVPIPGRYLRVLTATGVIRIQFESGEATDFMAGIGIQSEPFRSFLVTSPVAQDVVIAVSDRLIDDNRMQAEITALPPVTLAGLQGAFTSTQKTIGTSSAQLASAKSDRRYLMVQNKHGSTSLWVNLAGVAATQANGVLVAPGGSLEVSGYAPSGEIRGICDAAGNSDIVVVEG